MKLIKNLLPHITIILSGIFIVLLILDGYNPTMNFINNPVSLKLLWIFCIISIVNSIIAVVRNRRAFREKNEG